MQLESRIVEPLPPVETGGSEGVRVCMAGLAVRVRCSHPGVRSLLRQRYAGFEHGGADLLEARVECSPGETAYASMNPAITIEAGAIRFNRPDYRGMIDLGQGDVWLKVRSAHPVEDIDAFLRILFGFLAFERGGLMLHAAAIHRRGRGFLFLGRSGAGKTTVCRVSKADRTLNDDLVILYPERDGWMIHSTPFTNPSQVRPNRLSAPAAGLYRLVQAREVRLRPLTPGEALAEVIASIPVLTQDPSRLGALLSRCEQLISDVPAYSLDFLPDDSFWQVVDP